VASVSASASHSIVKIGAERSVFAGDRTRARWQQTQVRRCQSAPGRN
jgi:hypothetical protein